MINKTIHYCWFGKNKKNELIKKCINSWKKNCPEYKIIEWNEENFDINSNLFVKEAYENKKWAFVSDYVRLYALQKYGGIYLDTDVELTHSLESFLKYDFFCGKESESCVMTALIGSVKGNTFINKFIEYYDERNFKLDSGDFDMTTNVKIISNILGQKFDIKNSGEQFEFYKNSFIFDESYFCEKVIDKQNYAIHHFEGGWVPREYLKANMLLYKNQYMILSKLINKSFDNSFGKKIQANKSKKICIYGFGSIGKLLYSILLQNNIRNIVIYDQEYIEEYRNITEIEQIEKLANYVIVTVWKDYEKIKCGLKNENIEIVNILDILEFSEKKF